MVLVQIGRSVSDNASEKSAVFATGVCSVPFSSSASAGAAAGVSEVASPDKGTSSLSKTYTSKVSSAVAAAFCISAVQVWYVAKSAV